MNRVLSVSALTVFLFTAWSCSSTKPPAPAAIQGNRTVTALKDISGAYERKNLPAFMALISENFRDRQALSAAVSSVFSKYKTVRFAIQYTRMFIMIEDRGMTKATFNWESDWQTPGGDLLKNSGRATFVFEPKTGKLISIDGKNPFIPQTLQNPRN